MRIAASRGRRRDYLLLKAGRTVTQKGNPDRPSYALDEAQLRHISEITIGHYDRTAEDYTNGVNF